MQDFKVQVYHTLAPTMLWPSLMIIIIANT